MLLVHCAYIPIFHKFVHIFSSFVSSLIPILMMMLLCLGSLVLVAALFQRLCDKIRLYTSKIE